jgi:ubiquitin-like-conjugating enzyme ATG10
MMAHHDEYMQWPFLTEEEFELACAFFDQRYVRASLGPTRQIFKIRSRRTATTRSSYIEILRILQLAEDEDELSLALAKLGKGGGDLGSAKDVEMDTTEEDADEVSEML